MYEHFIAFKCCLSTLTSGNTKNSIYSTSSNRRPPPIFWTKKRHFSAQSWKINCPFLTPIPQSEKNWAYLYNSSSLISLFMYEQTSLFLSFFLWSLYGHSFLMPWPFTSVPFDNGRSSASISPLISTLCPSLNNFVRGWHNLSGICPRIDQQFSTLIALSLCSFCGSKLNCSIVPTGRIYL